MTVSTEDHYREWLREQYHEFEIYCKQFGAAYAYGKSMGRSDWGQKMQQLIPQHMHEGVAYYIVLGRPVGEFLQSVISSDLFGAAGRADDMNQNALFNYCRFFYNCAPGGCYGHHDAYKGWVAQNGTMRMAYDSVHA